MDCCIARGGKNISGCRAGTAGRAAVVGWVAILRLGNGKIDTVDMSISDWSVARCGGTGCGGTGCGESALTAFGIELDRHSQ